MKCDRTHICEAPTATWRNCERTATRRYRPGREPQRRNRIARARRDGRRGHGAVPGHRARPTRTASRVVRSAARARGGRQERKPYLRLVA
eukprot:169898-Prymnesium_polylepis.2